MEVRGYSRSLTTEQCQALGIQHCQSLEEAVDGADALSVHLPKNDNTTHIINAELSGNDVSLFTLFRQRITTFLIDRILSKMNDGAYVVNCSRGGGT